MLLSASNSPASLFQWDRFPKASKYDPSWVIENPMGPKTSEERGRYLGFVLMVAPRREAAR